MWVCGMIGLWLLHIISMFHHFIGFPLNATYSHSIQFNSIASSSFDLLWSKSSIKFSLFLICAYIEIRSLPWSDWIHLLYRTPSTSHQPKLSNWPLHLVVFFVFLFCLIIYIYIKNSTHHSAIIHRTKSISFEQFVNSGYTNWLL